jgi:hypothetical protein
MGLLATGAVDAEVGGGAAAGGEHAPYETSMTQAARRHLIPIEAMSGMLQAGCQGSGYSTGRVVARPGARASGQVRLGEELLVNTNTLGAQVASAVAPGHRFG